MQHHPGRRARARHSSTPRRVLRCALVAVNLTLGTSCVFASGIEQLKAFVAQVHAARGEFVQQQVKVPKAVQNTQGASAAPAPLQTGGNSSGTFAFARPGRFIWSYEKPYQQLLQADGDTLYVYDKDLNQVTERKLGNALGASPAAILFGSNDLERNFTLRDAGMKNGIDWLELVPKAKDTQFERVGIGFRDGNLAAMELHDMFGNVTLLTFSAMQKNPPIRAGEFRFMVPKGADVING